MPPLRLVISGSLHDDLFRSVPVCDHEHSTDTSGQEEGAAKKGAAATAAAALAAAGLSEPAPAPAKPKGAPKAKTAPKKKAAAKAAAPPPAAKIKSVEIINDSDEDDGMDAFANVLGQAVEEADAPLPGYDDDDEEEEDDEEDELGRAPFAGYHESPCISSGFRSLANDHRQ